MLTLPIKKKWFDMILKGEKLEEYREIKPYYSIRFRNVWGYPAYWGEEHEVKFRNGYSASSPSFVAVCTLAIGKGKPEWGAEPVKNYYILRVKRTEWSENGSNKAWRKESEREGGSEKKNSEKDGSGSLR